jgi:hypothetical protein
MKINELDEHAVALTAAVAILACCVPRNSGTQQSRSSLQIPTLLLYILSYTEDIGKPVPLSYRWRLDMSFFGLNIIGF